MPDQVKSTAGKSSAKSAEIEINKLRAQVHDLQAELSRRERGLNNPNNEYEDDRYSRRARFSAQSDKSGDEFEDDAQSSSGRRSRDRRSGQYDQVIDDATDIATDLPVRMMDEASKFVRGLAFAYLEQLRYVGDVLNTFADEVMTRNQPQRRSNESEDRRFEAQVSTSSRSGSDRDDQDDRYGESRSRNYRFEYENEIDDRSGRSYRSRNRDDEQREERGRRSGGSRRRTMTGLATDLPTDIYSGFVRALDRSLDIPGAAVERFNDTYRETEEEAAPSLTRSRRAERDSPISERRREHSGDRGEGGTPDELDSDSSTRLEAGVSISEDPSDS